METPANNEPSLKLTGWILDKSVTPGAHLTQGDLITFNDNDPLRKVGIVVTADCDLQNRKHARLVTLVPLVPVKVIVERYLLIEDCEFKRSKIEDFAFKYFKIDTNQEENTKKSILADRVAKLVLEENDPVRMAAYFTLDQLDVVPIETYKALMPKIGMSAKGMKALGDQVRSRGDLLILPDASSLGVDGNVAWVRHIWQHPLNGIAIKTSEVIPEKGERVARLDSPYRYRLTQVMAQVFSDIGLPDIPDYISKNLEKVYVND